MEEQVEVEEKSKNQEILELKARAYDLMSYREQVVGSVNSELTEINKRLTKLHAE